MTNILYLEPFRAKKAAQMENQIIINMKNEVVEEFNFQVQNFHGNDLINIFSEDSFEYDYFIELCDCANREWIT